ncbi:hypothetical protein JCM11251_002596 [Rhodosporidiobolus azoricus]
MQSLVRRTANLALGSSVAAARGAAPSCSRALATVVSTPFDPPTVSSPSGSARSSPSDLSVPLPHNPRVVLPSSSSSSTPNEPVAPISKHSSRLTGRTQRKPRKSTSPTELNAAGSLGERVHATQGKVNIFLPHVFMRLVRNTGEHRDDPYTATFRTHLELTKPDITNYLKNVYGLEVTSIRTMNYLSKLKRSPVGGGMTRSGGTKNYKKVLVTMTEPFWYPSERSRGWLNEHFERDRMEELRDRKMLKIGDGHKHGVGAQRYRGANKSRAELDRLREVSKKGGNDVEDKPGEDASRRSAAGLKKMKNVIRSRAEKLSERQDAVEQEMERLREAGW